MFKTLALLAASCALTDAVRVRTHNRLPKVHLAQGNAKQVGQFFENEGEYDNEENYDESIIEPVEGE